MTTSTSRISGTIICPRLGLGPQLLAGVEIDADPPAPAARAAAQARRVPSAPFAPSAGVIPVTCSQSAPLTVAFQSTASGFISAD